MTKGVCCRAMRVVPLAPAQAYGNVVDPLLFPRLFRGWGPVPGVAAVDAERLETGARRRVRLDDGSAITETVLSVRPGRALRYEASGHAAPVRWWACGARAAWRFEPQGRGTRVTWVYRFRPRGVVGTFFLRWVVKPAFRRAMARALGAIAAAGEVTVRSLSPN